jgi:murein L,D-transpeptidase YafK
VTTFLLAAVMAGEAPFGSNVKADRIVIVKHERTLTLMSGRKALKTYRIALGSEPVGPKHQQGDHKTPEGSYVLDRRNARSRYYRSIHITYPAAEQRAEAVKAGTDPGAGVMIHGLPNGFGRLGSRHRTLDWTEGCVAVTDEEMDEIWEAVDDGTPIDIKP